MILDSRDFTPALPVLINCQLQRGMTLQFSKMRGFENRKDHGALKK